MSQYAGLSLPSVDVEGHPANWTIDDKETGTTLDSQTTLLEGNVVSGHHLYLRRQVVAGGGGPVTPPTRGHIKVRVFTQSGDGHSIDTPSDITAEEFIAEVVAGLNLPSVDVEGHAVNWTIDDGGTGKSLNGEKSLFENWVGEGHHLYLRRRVVAGGGGPVTPPRPSTVEFTVSYPRSITRQTWYTLLTYVHVPEAASAVQNHTDLILGSERLKSYLSVGKRPTKSVEPGAQITVVPEFPGCRMNPPHGIVSWLEDWHCVEFRFKLESDVEPNKQGQALEGRVTFYVGPILVSEITVSPTLENKQFRASGPPITAMSEGYQAVFVSYSHEDSEIVDQLEKAYRVLGMEYLRDIRVLRSGDTWNSTLLGKIEVADVFQLCWSQAAKRSEYVTREWRHALAQKRKSFVRPMYWQIPMPEPPPELAEIHFAYLSLKTN